MSESRNVKENGIEWNVGLKGWSSKKEEKDDRREEGRKMTNLNGRRLHQKKQEGNKRRLREKELNRKGKREEITNEEEREE